MIGLGDQTEWHENKLEKLRYEYDLKKGDYVLDIGSYRREFADEIIKRYGCEVECFDALDQRAAWIKDGTITMGGAFLYTSIYTEGGTEFRCVDIARYLNKEVALCKVNIEGAEYVLLKYIIEKGLHKNIKNLQVQFHMVDGQDWERWYDDIATELIKTHRLTWRYPFVWENWERC